MLSWATTLSAKRSLQTQTVYSRNGDTWCWGTAQLVQMGQILTLLMLEMLEILGMDFQGDGDNVLSAKRSNPKHIL